MFEVKGVPILVDEVEVLKELRRQVYEQQGREILKKIKISFESAREYSSIFRGLINEVYKNN